MPPTPDAPPTNQIPLAVDLDGTLIRTDLLWESLARLLRRNPFAIFQVSVLVVARSCFIETRTRPRASKLIPPPCPINEKFLAFCANKKPPDANSFSPPRPICKWPCRSPITSDFLTKCLAATAKPTCAVKTNSRALTEKFGARGFDYAGNSAADFAVWRGAREAIVVNASRAVLKTAGECAKLGPTFTDGYSPFAILKSVLNELFIRSGYLLAIAAGLLLAAAFPKFGIAGFAWVAPALILFAARGKTGGDAFRAGYSAGISFWLASIYWLLLIPVAGFPILGWFALSAFMAVYFGIWTWLLAGKTGAGSWTQRNLWSLAGAAAWVALEIFRAYFLGGFPWNLLGTSQYHLTPLIQIASVTGVYGVSFLVVWASLSLFSADPDDFFQTGVALCVAAGSFSAAAGRRDSVSPSAVSKCGRRRMQIRILCASL